MQAPSSKPGDLGSSSPPHVWLSHPSIWDLAVLAKIGSNNYLFNKFALRKYQAYSLWALQVIWECMANPTLSLQTGMRGHIQATGAAHHKMISAFQHAHTVTLTRQLRFFTFVVISGCSKSTQMLFPGSRRWCVQIHPELLLAKDTPSFCTPPVSHQVTDFVN